MVLVSYGPRADLVDEWRVFWACPLEHSGKPHENIKVTCRSTNSFVAGRLYKLMGDQLLMGTPRLWRSHQFYFAMFLLMDDDTAFAKRHGGAGINWRACLVVIDHGIAIVHIPDAQAEFVDAATAGHLSIDHSD